MNKLVKLVKLVRPYSRLVHKQLPSGWGPTFTTRSPCRRRRTWDGLPPRGRAPVGRKWTDLTTWNRGRWRRFGWHLNGCLVSFMLGNDVCLRLWVDGQMVHWLVNDGGQLVVFMIRVGWIMVHPHLLQHVLFQLNMSTSFCGSCGVWLSFLVVSQPSKLGSVLENHPSRYPSWWPTSWISHDTNYESNRLQHNCNAQLLGDNNQPFQEI